jgi:hypothetical protein
MTVAAGSAAGRICPPSYGYSPAAFSRPLADFDRTWPAGSAAAVSYRRRIIDGPDFSIDDALGRAARARAACA